MPQHQITNKNTLRIPEQAASLVNECREYLEWEELRLSSILKCLSESAKEGATSPFETAVDGDSWSPGPGMIQRERIKGMISNVCGTLPSHSSLAILMGRLTPQEAAKLQKRRNTVRSLAQAVHSAARGWMRRIAIMQLGVECTLQELTGGAPAYGELRRPWSNLDRKSSTRHQFQDMNR